MKCRRVSLAHTSPNAPARGLFGYHSQKVPSLARAGLVFDDDAMCGPMSAFAILKAHGPMGHTAEIA